MDLMNIFHIIGLIIAVVIHIFIINWLNKMNSCKCSSSFPEKKYLYEWFTIMIIWLIIYNIIFISTNGNISMPLMALNAIFGLINLAMVIRLFIYLRKLRETKCNCGTLRELNTIYYYLIFIFSILGFVILMSIILGILAGFTVSKVKSVKSNKNKSLK
jgi:hydrogenase-4 membrane subunit HyfE